MERAPDPTITVRAKWSLSNLPMLAARVKLDVTACPIELIHSPVNDMALCFLKCGATPSLAEVLHLYAQICELGVETHPKVGNHLIYMMAEVDSFSYAEQAFNRLVHKSESSWNSLIAACVRCRNPHLALELYHMMQENGSLTPNSFAFIALLKSCAALKDLEKGSELHDLMKSSGGFSEMDACIASTLVNMYCKCGALTKAHDVLVNLPARDVVSWTALISGYAENGCGDEMFTCIEKMQHEGITPNAHTLVCSLKVCCTMEVLEKGEEIHADIVKKGFEGDTLVGNTLIDMYAKCGSLETAQFVFEMLLSRTLVSWTVLIAAYADHGYGEEALLKLNQMRQEKISPDALTFVCSLTACGNLGESTEGMYLHGEIVAKGFERELFIGSAVVDMYAKYGLVGEAYEVFAKLQNKDVIVWTALIAGFAEHGCDMEAVSCFQQMQSEGVSPNTLTFVNALQACTHIATICEGQEMHGEIIIKGLEQEPLIGGSLVAMYAKCGCLTEALAVFDKFPAQHVVLWTALLAGYAEQGYGEKALNSFKEMENEGVAPNSVAYVCSLKACTTAGFMITGLQLHADILKKGFEEQPLVWNTLIDMYIKFGLLATAQFVFDRLPVRDAVSWNALIGGYVDSACGEEAVCSFERMRCEGTVCMNSLTYVCSLRACGSIGASLMGHKIHDELIKKGLEKAPLVGNASMDMFAKCGLIAEAQKAFDRLVNRDVISWNTLTSAYAQLGDSESVFSIVDAMVGEGIKPDLVTLSSVVNGCSHAGSVKEGLVLFEDFNSPDYGIVPTLEHHNCLIDLLGRSGHVEEALAMITMMPLHPDIVVWHTILGACQRWGNPKIGRHAFDHALEFDAQNVVLYLCMRCIYLQASLPEEAQKVEQMRVETHGWGNLKLEQWRESGQFWA